MRNKTAKALNMLILFFCLLFSVLVLVLNFFYTASVSYDLNELVSYENEWKLSVISVLVLALTVALISLLRRVIVKLPPKRLFVLFSCLYIMIALYLILNVDHSLRADALSVSNSAKNMMAGNYEAFEAGGYIHRYPHQLGLAFYDMVLYSFSQNVLINFIVNFFMVLGINYTVMKISEVVFGDVLSTLLTVVLSFAFFPQLFFILFAYGLIPGLFFMVLAFYNCLLFCKDGKKRSLLGVVIFASLSVMLKKNFMIGVIAMMIYIAVKTVKKYRHAYIAAICLLLVAMVLPMELLTLHFEKSAGLKLDEGCPTVLWLAMGTDIDNEERAPGWYDRSNYFIYTDSGFDKEKSEEIGNEKLKNNIEKIKKEPGRAVSFFVNKTVSQWCEPLYSSVWSGPLAVCGQYTHTEYLQSLYSGQEAERTLRSYAKFITLTIWLLCVCFLMEYGKRIDGWQIFFMFFAGGLLFHTVWEGKSQYIYPYVFCLIPFAAYALARGAEYFKALSSRVRHNFSSQKRCTSENEG